MKTLLKGGTVVSAAGSRVADVLVDGEKIAAVGEGLAVDGAKVVDVRGKLLFHILHRVRPLVRIRCQKLRLRVRLCKIMQKCRRIRPFRIFQKTFSLIF